VDEHHGPGDQALRLPLPVGRFAGKWCNNSYNVCYGASIKSCNWLGAPNNSQSSGLFVQ